MSLNNLIADLSKQLACRPFRTHDPYRYGLVINKKQQIDLHASTCENYLDLIAPLVCVEHQLSADLCFNFLRKTHQILVSENVCFALNSHRDELCLRRTLLMADLSAETLWRELTQMTDIAQNWSGQLTAQGFSSLRQ